jgi:hypothetical protein
MPIKDEHESKTHVDAWAALRYRILKSHLAFRCYEGMGDQKGSRQTQPTPENVRIYDIDASWK